MKKAAEMAEKNFFGWKPNKNFRSALIYFDNNNTTRTAETKTNNHKFQKFSAAGRIILPRDEESKRMKNEICGN